MYGVLPAAGGLEDQDLETLLTHLRMHNLATRLQSGSGGSVGFTNAVKMAQKLGIDTSKVTMPKDEGMGATKRKTRPAR